MDLNLCQQMQATWGYRRSQRLADYGRDFTEAAKDNFIPQIVREKH